jgi:hypothetical protein
VSDEDERTVEERADRAMELIKELSDEEAMKATAKAYANVASHAVMQIGNMLHDHHEHEAAAAVRRTWNLFVQVIQPLWMDEGECPHDHEGPDEYDGTERAVVSAVRAGESQESPDQSV